MIALPGQTIAQQSIYLVAINQEYHITKKRTCSWRLKVRHFASSIFSETTAAASKKSRSSLRNEWEVVGTECDALGEGTANCQHCKPSILQLLHLHAFLTLS